MRRAELVAAVCAVATLAAAPAQASPERGKELYELHCGGCHYERVHERDRWRSKINSMADLRAEVARWAKQTKHAFTAEDLGDIVEYLDQSHYQLKR
jgi:cytochrome c5